MTASLAPPITAQSHRQKPCRHRQWQHRSLCAPSLTVRSLFRTFLVLYIYIYMGFPLFTKIRSKWHNKNRILLFSQNFNSGHIRDVNIAKVRCQLQMSRILSMHSQKFILILHQICELFPIQCAIQKSSNFWVKKWWKLPFHDENQYFEILRLEYLLNTCKYHAKNFFLLCFCDFEHIKTGFRRFKILALTVDIKSPVCMYVWNQILSPS